MQAKQFKKFSSKNSTQKELKHDLMHQLYTVTDGEYIFHFIPPTYYISVTQPARSDAAAANPVKPPVLGGFPPQAENALSTAAC